MPTYCFSGEPFWNFQSTTKYFRRTKQRLEGRLWLVLDRKYSKMDRMYLYKLLPA